MHKSNKKCMNKDVLRTACDSKFQMCNYDICLVSSFCNSSSCVMFSNLCFVEWICLKILIISCGNFKTRFQNMKIDFFFLLLSFCRNATLYSDAFYNTIVMSWWINVMIMRMGEKWKQKLIIQIWNKNKNAW